MPKTVHCPIPTTTVSKFLVETELESEVHKDLLNRKLFKRVFQVKVVLTEDEKTNVVNIKRIKELIDDKLKELRTKSIFAVSDMFKNEVFKDAKEKTVLIGLKAEKKYKFSDDWVAVGKEFKLANVTVLMLRIYLKRTFSSSLEFEDMKDKILLTIKDEITNLQKFSS
ncbi:hypothetical protein [Chitinophaga sancti]|uniref:Uncharacterized protein n=1 Tax=Chitinophaga sancti TaxID=1004 RepID=A0A1K1SSA8_9BACT|nr:hypothetical protein [Chitinophaga sancti]WQD65428.1 hypothetical protein U0033_13590 [Chitinophaga sancti]WQG88949.1 hypothetical protein SR876_28880 [Chitinophaga sancti]SFW87296.1 hypothetical protein SAMN05661012_06042 [Chitinophaga sancti]